MYTFFAIPPVDTLNDHGGFIVIAFISLIFLLAVISATKDDMIDFVMAMIVGALLILIICIAGFVSWHTGDIKYYPNEEVIGVYVGTTSQDYTTTERQGKSNVQVAHHYLYVSYKVPEGIVTFNASPGIVYPERAILYKN